METSHGLNHVIGSNLEYPCMELRDSTSASRSKSFHYHWTTKHNIKRLLTPPILAWKASSGHHANIRKKIVRGFSKWLRANIQQVLLFLRAAVRLIVIRFNEPMCEFPEITLDTHVGVLIWFNLIFSAFTSLEIRRQGPTSCQ